TLTIICKLKHNCLMNEMLVYFRTEHCIVQFHCANFFAFHIIYRYVSHLSCSSFQRTYLPDLTVSLMVIMDFFGPGTAPFTNSKLFSASTLTTSRFWMVTFLLPICPGILFPLNTLLGSEQAPLEPA